VDCSQAQQAAVAFGHQLLDLLATAYQWLLPSLGLLDW